MIFENLNNDCLQHIIQYLDLPSQVALMNVSTRLANSVQDQWHHQTDFDLNGEKVDFEIGNERYENVLTIISARVLKMTVVLCQQKQFLLLQKFTFSNLKTLDIRLNYSWDEAEVDIEDESIKQLAIICPALTSLTLLGSITGKYLWNFTELKELQLDGCHELNSEHFNLMFTTLKLRKLSLLYYDYQMEFSAEDLMTIEHCNTLEELHIDDQFLVRHVIDNVLGLPRLRRLTCYTCDFHENIIRSVANFRKASVIAVIYNDMFWSSSVHFESLTKLINLRILCLTSDDFDADQLSSLKNYWPHLRELHYTEHRGLIGKELLNFIDLPHVELLNLTGTKLWSDTFQIMDWKNSIPMVLNRRTKPLKIHLTEPNPDVQKEIMSIDHPMLDISFEPLKIHELPSRFMQIDFLPLD